MQGKLGLSLSGNLKEINTEKRQVSSFIHLRYQVVKFLMEFNPPHGLSETIYSGLRFWSREWNLVGLLVQQNPVDLKFTNPKSLLIIRSPNYNAQSRQFYVLSLMNSQNFTD